MGRINDLTNKQFGYLIAQYPTNKRINGKVVWKCKCICGKECEIISSNLIAGRTKSCGCKQYEIVSQHYKEKCPKKEDIINGTKVLDFEYRPDNRGFNECYILAQCKYCYKSYWVKATLLKNGNTQSCGCCKNSIGETIIQSILDDNNISYEREKIFKDCYYQNPCNKCRFDFYIENKYLLEFDGIQHFNNYKTYSSSWFTDKELEKIRKRDKYKNEWCLKNNIPLIRIPYYKLDTICIDDLLLDKSNYVIIKEKK